MKVFVCFFMLMFGTAISDLSWKCDLVSFYQELACKPKPNPGNTSLCPTSYSCPARTDPTACYYKGIAYGKDRKKITKDVIDYPCFKLCSCNSRGLFDCPIYDCRDDMHRDFTKKCIYTGKLDECCSTAICDKDVIASLKTCEVDGKTYKEGEIFHPQDTFKRCVCTADWNGSTEGTNCRDKSCGVEMQHQGALKKNCAPIFYEHARSIKENNTLKNNCPIDFQCPSVNSKVISKSKRDTNKDQCLFGNLTLSVGDEVTVDTKCTKCYCIVPPLVTCVQIADCHVKTTLVDVK